MIAADAVHPLFDSLMVAVVSGLVVGLPAFILALFARKKAVEVHRQMKPSNGRTVAQTVEASNGALCRVELEIANLKYELGRHFDQHADRDRRWRE